MQADSLSKDEDVKCPLSFKWLNNSKLRLLTRVNIHVFFSNQAYSVTLPASPDVWVVMKMGRFEKFTIPFVGLATGHHQFAFEIDDSFFVLFENTVINEAEVHVDLDLHKTNESLTLLFRLQGNVKVTCDRCLEPFMMPVDTLQGVIVKFGDEQQGDDDEVVVIPHGSHEINVAQHIYDFISLQIPYRVVHPDKADGTSGCDPEFISRMNDLEVSDEEKPEDPRWDALKKIKLRDN